MSVVHSALLLVGIFGVPIALLVIGHRFRRLGPRMRGAFWGGAVGYALGALVWTLAAIVPAQMWAQDSIRLSAVVTVLALFGVAGAGFGALVGNKPKRPHRHRRKGAAPNAREHASVAPDTRTSTARDAR